MKTPKHIFLMHILLAGLMLAPSARAQTAEGPQTEIENGTPNGAAIAAARSQYTNHADAEGISRAADDGVLLAQHSRRPPMPPPPHRGHAAGNYGTRWADHPNGHTLIGAAIGAGLGAALGANVSAGPHHGANVPGVLLLGGLGAAFGGAIGSNFGSSGPFAHHRRVLRPSPATDEESDLAADSAGSHLEDAHAERPASGIASPTR